MAVGAGDLLVELVAITVLGLEQILQLPALLQGYRLHITDSHQGVLGKTDGTALVEGLELGVAFLHGRLQLAHRRGIGIELDHARGFRRWNEEIEQVETQPLLRRYPLHGLLIVDWSLLLYLIAQDVIDDLLRRLLRLGCREVDIDGDTGGQHQQQADKQEFGGLHGRLLYSDLMDIRDPVRFRVMVGQSLPGSTYSTTGPSDSAICFSCSTRLLQSAVVLKPMMSIRGMPLPSTR